MAEWDHSNLSRFIVLLGVEPSPHVIFRPSAAVRELAAVSEQRMWESHWRGTGYVLLVENAYGQLEDAEVFVRQD